MSAREDKQLYKIGGNDILYRGFSMLLIIAMLLFQVVCSSDNQGQSPLELGDDLSQALGGMALRESQNGVLKWVMTADSAYQVSDEEPTQLIRLHIDFYNETGDTITSWLSSLSGEIDEKTKKMVARDSVIVETKDGKTLETEELYWDEVENQVVSDYFVRITTGESIMTGIGIKSDPQLNSCQILSDVEAEMYEDDQGLQGIESNR